MKNELISFPVILNMFGRRLIDLVSTAVARS